MKDKYSFADNFSLCERHGIRVYPVHNGRYKYRVDVEERLKTRIKVREGRKYYPIKENGKERSVYDKIKEAYSILAQRIRKKELLTKKQ